MIVYGGRTTYGHELGILMLDTRFPRIEGDIGNAASFQFPVAYAVVEGASPRRVVEEADRSLLDPFIAAAKRLESMGVGAITTSCGFLAIFQKELSSAINVPFYSSSLLQIPFLYDIFGKRGKAGILTAKAGSLTERHVQACNAHGIPMAIGGMDNSPNFTRVFLEKGEGDSSLILDTAIVEKELITVALELISSHPDISFIVLECTNMPPFRDAIRKATGKPVFDIITLANYIHEGLSGHWRSPCKG
jgi:hypothetical protein